MSDQKRPDGLLAWQWRVYDATHRDRLNLAIHMVGVPAFIAGVLAAIVQVMHARWFGVLVSLLVAITAYALQTWGHLREKNRPQPFQGAADLLARAFAEEFVTFPRFVLSGKWVRNFAEQENRG